MVGLLWLSERFQWFSLNHHKGWTVLIAVAAVVMAAVVMLLWWIAGLIVHWRFQFGIRSLLMLVLVCSIAAGWLAVEKDRARRQADLVDGGLGWFFYDWEFDADDKAIMYPKPPGECWLSKMLGDNFFSAIVWANYYNSEITDAGLERLNGLTDLRTLLLRQTKVTDAGLKNIKGLTNLRFLELTGTWTTDAGLECLKGLTNLRHLELPSTKITDAGLESLTGLTKLQSLNLSLTPITDAGLKHLDGLKQLQQLRLLDTGVTDAGVQKLQQSLPNCQIEY